MKLLILLILYIGKYIISIISIIGIIGIISIAACYWWFYMNIIDDILAWGISIMVFYYGITLKSQSTNTKHLCA